MTLQQLRYLCAVADRGFNVSQAAQAVHATQPALSAQIRRLESELKTEIFVRRRGRLSGLTQTGAAIVQVARRMLVDAQTLQRLPRAQSHDTGVLVLAMTHTHARYGLLPAIARFRKRFPEVELTLRQGSPAQVFEWVERGEVQIGVANELPSTERALVALACRSSPANNMARCVIVPAGHPLLGKRRVTLEDLARYPMITLDPAMTGGRAVRQAFERKGLEPRVVMRAADADVAKAYVELGLGIAVLPGVAYDRRRDPGLRAIEASALFGTGTLVMALHPHAYLLGFLYEFIALVSPEWTRAAVDERLAAARPRSPVET